MRIGLALGSGGAKGFAHIGVMQVLQEASIKIDCIAGSSMGALVGGLFALGKTPTELEQFAIKYGSRSKKDFIKKTFSSESIYSYKRIHKKLYKLFKDTTFADTKIPFYALATDLIRGEKVILNSGNLLDAIEASSRIPMYYPPKKIGEMVLVDGAVTCPVPVGALKEDCDFIISISLPIYDVKSHPRHFLKMVNIIDRSISILVDKLVHTETNCEQPNFVFEINELAKYSAFDFEHAKNIIDLGRQAATKALPLLLKRIAEQKNKNTEEGD